MKASFCTILTLFYLQSQAQTLQMGNYLEAGILLGVTNYSGDVAQERIVPAETNLAYGALLRYHFNSQIAIRTNAVFSKISGSDRHASRADLKERSLNFTSNLFELSFMAEWNFLHIRPKTKHNQVIARLVPYLYGGLGYLFSSPDVGYYGPPDKFQQLVQHGLPEPGLARNTLVLPLGIGLRSMLNDYITLGMEGGLRPTLSDDLDGVSLNGKPETNDWIGTVLATVSYTF